MESIGEKLRSAREAKGITFDQIYRDTNIPKKYLEALEAEDFAQFPGDTYLLGFMRSYGDYLGLDTKELVAMYKAIQIQEQPVPMEQLLRDPKPAHRWPLFAGAGAAVVVLGVVLFFVLKPKPDVTATEQKVRKPVEYVLSSGTMEKRYYLSDVAIVQLGAQKYRIEVSQITDRVILTSPAGESSVELGQEIPLDVNADGSADVKIFVADLVKNKSDKGVLLRMSLDAAAVASAANTGTAAANEQPAAASPAGAAGAAGA
ncbi:MAG: helix-turn-helix domain-containing protein, partial [Treponema sp.]|nr:helix-turn-helix domain-containing protein [Treponema sp.]